MNWTADKILQLVLGQESERFNLEFKHPEKLEKKKDVAKIVSSMANSAGGTVIFGIHEADTKASELKHVDITKYTPEWFDSVIRSNVSPPIEFMVNPIDVDGVQVVVIEIEQSETAHQHNDGRYYRRVNTTTDIMKDFEIRDVMNRGSHPQLRLYVPNENGEPDELMSFTDSELNRLQEAPRQAELPLYLINDSLHVAEDMLCSLEFPKECVFRVIGGTPSESDCKVSTLLEPKIPRTRFVKGFPLLFTNIKLQLIGDRHFRQKTYTASLNIYCHKMPTKVIPIQIAIQKIGRDDYIWRARLKPQ